MGEWERSWEIERKRERDRGLFSLSEARGERKRWRNCIVTNRYAYTRRMWCKVVWLIFDSLTNFTDGTAVRERNLIWLRSCKTKKKEIFNYATNQICRRHPTTARPYAKVTSQFVLVLYPGTRCCLSTLRIGGKLSGKIQMCLNVLPRRSLHP